MIKLHITLPNKHQDFPALWPKHICFTIGTLCNNGTQDPLGVVYLMSQRWSARGYMNTQQYVLVPFSSHFLIHSLSIISLTQHIYQQRISTCITQIITIHMSTTNTPVYQRDSRSFLASELWEGQSVSVISVYMSSQSWEWHETHKTSLCQSCGLQQSVPPHYHRKKNIFLENKIGETRRFLESQSPCFGHISCKKIA